MMSPFTREAFVAAFTRRAAGHQGAARAVLEARLATLKAPATPGEADLPAARRTPAPRGSLGQLADGLAARHARGESLAGDPAQPASVTAPQRELGTLRDFRGAWSRLFAEQRLRQALAHVPQQAGPLNSHHLVHRALATMQEISPAYLQRFVSHVDTLLWLEQQQAPAKPQAARPEKRRKGTAR